MTASQAISPGEAIARPDLWAGAEIPFLPYGDGARNLALYMDLLLAWNRKLNLSGCDNAIELLRDLVQDSFFMASFIEELALRKKWKPEIAAIWDLGAGAGLPGIPLRIFLPFGKYTWVERRQKRALFLENVCARLALPGISGFCGDAAKFMARHSEGAQCIIARAFLPWQKLLEFCKGHLARCGSVIIMSNQAPPALPAQWQLDSSKCYWLPHKTHWLWALSQTDFT